MKLYKNHMMKEYSNMKIGGVAKEYIEVESIDELLEVCKIKKNIFILGNGTNTLLNDKELDKVFVSVKKIDFIKELGSNCVEVGAGKDFKKFTEYLKEKDYSGLENLAGIPGTVGGLVFMNGGAHGTEIFDKIVEVEVIDNEKRLRRIKKEELKFSYRVTEIKEKKWIVVSATFKFDKGFKADIVKAHMKKREERHPLNDPNLGSTFKNPDGYFSAKLIIEAGMQGEVVGDAQVSLVHPNFIINRGNATFEDVTTLIKKVKEKVKEKTGIDLEEEIIIVEK